MGDLRCEFTFERGDVISEFPEMAGTMQALGLNVAALDPASVDARLGSGISGTDVEGPGAAILEYWLQGLEDAHDVVLYLDEDRDSAWTRRSGTMS